MFARMMILVGLLGSPALAGNVSTADGKTHGGPENSLRPTKPGQSVGSYTTKAPPRIRARRIFPESL